MPDNTIIPPLEKNVLSEQNIKMYATRWCGDCRMAKRWFDAHDIPYEWINIEEDDDAAAYVVKVNRGMRSVPTIVFPDGSVLVEPSPRELANKLLALRK